jgi:cobalamin biosynthesis protein CobD/CbiB
MNYLPARLTFCWRRLPRHARLLGRKALRVGWSQHAVCPVNSGWSEATTAGAVQRKLVGPIWIHGQAVTDVAG